MTIDDTVKGADPHHMMLAASGATIGYMGYLLTPALFMAMPVLGPFAPLLTPLIGGIAGYYLAKKAD